MTNLYNKELKIITNFALEYRLSLKNICNLLNINPSEGNQKFVYEEIMRLLRDESLRKEVKYLIYETSLESEHDSNISYKIAKLYFLKYKREKSINTTESLKKAYSILYLTDIEYKKIKARGLSFPLSNEEALIITKYRIKHAITKDLFDDELGINRDTISKWENRIKILNPRIGKKITSLNDFHRDLANQYFKDRRKNG